MKIKNSLHLMSAALCGLFFTGCAAVTNITSSPSGASISVNGSVVGQTPLDTVLDDIPRTGVTYTICASRPGYVSQSRTFVKNRVEDSCPTVIPPQIHFELEKLTERQSRAIAGSHTPAPSGFYSAAFRGLAAGWRASSVRPVVPEEAGRREVLAENAVRENNLEVALQHLEQGLEEFPLWPGGHVNAARIAAEMGQYSRAADHAHCYVELLPDAPDSQSVKRNMIIWEEKAQTHFPAQWDPKLGIHVT